MNESMTLAVTTHVVGLGAARPTPPVYIVLTEQQTTARDVVLEHVRNEIIRTSQQRQTSLALHYLLASDVHAVPAASTALDLATETARAYAAIESGQCLLMVDGLAVQDLDQTLTLTERSRVGFVRLLPLIGG